MLLEIELVPRGSWGNNVRSKVPQSVWDQMRTRVYAQYDHKCGICHKKDKLAAHEIWHYDDNTCKQTLTGMIALCPMCHHVKHIGFAEVLSSQNKLDYSKVVEHFCNVNNCSMNEFINHRKDAFSLWSDRSKKHWTVDISYLTQNKE